MSALLIAGVGNIFRGDDAFGVEVARRLLQTDLPPGVQVRDFGIRGIDLTYALLDGCDAAILVDATAQGGAPGSLYVMEPDASADAALQPQELMLAPHDLDPNKVLRAVAAMNGRCRRLLLVGCEPAELGDELDGRMGLSAPVAAAVEQAVPLVRELIAQWLEQDSPQRTRRTQRN